MRRFRAPELILGCLLTVAVFAMGALFAWRPDPTKPRADIPQQNAAKKGEDAKSSDSELVGPTWLTKDAAGFFAFVSALVVGGQAAMFFIQLRYMRIGMRDTTRAAKAAERAAKATEESVDLARRTAERQLRPYVHASEAHFIWDGIGARVIVRCSNSGETPATYFEFGATSRVIWRGRADDLTIPTDLTYRRWSALGGGDSKSIGSRGAATENGADPYGEDARAVHEAKGKKNFFLLGRLRYGDVFGNEYETEFAFFTSNTRPDHKNPDRVRMINPPGNFIAFRLTERGQAT
jgi:hypothetical protein